MLTYQHFRAGGFTTWEQMLAQVAEFASSLGPDGIVAI